MFLSGAIMEIEIACICFMASSFMKRGGMAVGIGISMMLYFVNIVSNIADEAKFLKYVTPFAYSDSAKILTDGEINLAYLICGAVILAASVAVTFIGYNKKDIS
jgi:ABC-2 type transport system permease protein